MFSLYAIWLLSLLSFIWVIKKSYLHTFFNLETASEFQRKTVMSLKDQDDIKASYFFSHPDVREGWGDELLRPWTLKNWDRWEDEKPAWFNDTW